MIVSYLFFNFFSTYSYIISILLFIIYPFCYFLINLPRDISILLIFSNNNFWIRWWSVFVFCYLLWYNFSLYFLNIKIIHRPLGWARLWCNHFQDCRQEEKGMIEDETVEWHHRLNEHEFEQTLGDSEQQASLSCCSPWGYKESDMT